ncbi:hypothetical protein MRX96_045004 [Rhipicephalus microplus]
MPDVRGPGQGRNVNNARELVGLTQDFGLQDAWILIKGNTFVPTWKRGSSETRLDRFYVSEAMSPVVAKRGEFPPAAVLKALDRAVFSFFWDRNTERLQRDALRLPWNLGGFGLPCIGTTAQLLALKTVLGILDDVGGTRKTTRHVFSRPAAQSASPPENWEICARARRTPPYYKALVALSRELTAMDPDLDPREIAPARLCEQLVSARGTLRCPPLTFPWPRINVG